MAVSRRRLADLHHRVDTPLPGAPGTPLYRAWARNAKTREFIRNLCSLKRIATAEEIARVALFLAADAASFVTGAALAAEGDVSIYRG